ncbi:MAG: hypothetical protein NC343_03360 [Muribaculum sp.]|nr:hypothetical protein [Muribaculaceae bacterium]MCM1080765.1 hypothetical protein [Muribaculum sp.]
MEPTYIAALEIGSSHIRGAVATVDPEGTITLLATEEEYVADAIRYGWIQNVDDVSNRINRLVRKLENYKTVSPRKIKAVYTGIGGRSMAANTTVVERHFDDETKITGSIMAQLKDEARHQLLSDSIIVDVIPRRIIIDGRDTLKPIGTFGSDISVEFAVISCRQHGQRNLDRAVTERQALAIKGTFVRQTALANLVLTNDEKNLGCMLVDFGAETIGISIYKNDALHYMVTLPIGSRCITRDIMSLNYTEERAEGIKKLIGDAVNADPGYKRNDFEGDPKLVNSYVRARAGELAINIIEQAKYAGLNFTADIPCGIVLAGAGAKLRGFAELLRQQSGAKVRIASAPSSIRISDTRMQTYDLLDVIAILNAAATNQPQECTEAPHVAIVNTETGNIATADTDTDIDETDGPGPQPKRQKKQRKSIFTGISNYLSTIFDEPEDSEEEDKKN